MSAPRVLCPATALRRWNFDDIAPDLTVHPHVEVREVQLSPLGTHMTFVRMYGGMGAKIEGTRHPHEHESVVVLKGYVIANIGGLEYEGGPRTVFDIRMGEVHGYTPKDRCLVELLAIYNPPAPVSFI